MIDINGRNPFAKLNYKEINQKFGGDFGVGLGGQVQEIKDFKWLDKTQNYDVPLYPQRTVVQFNSTYMELVGRQDRIRGDVTFGSLFFLGLISGVIYLGFVILYDEFLTGSFLLGILASTITLAFIVAFIYLLALLSTELFSYTYLPIRFNRKTRKVYVRQANRQVQVFDWDELKFYMATTYKVGGDVRGITLADDGMTITGMFSLPFVSDLTAKEILGGTQLKQHFEFVRRYMEGDDKQLEEVKSAVRYVHSVHQKRETPLISFQRVILAALDSDENMEYPKQALKLHWTHSAVIIQLWLRYLGRLLSINTSITPKFSPEIEAECQIDPNDPHDLNKYLPEGNIEDANQPIWKKLTYSILLILFGIVMLFVFAFFIDMIGAIKGYDTGLAYKLLHLFHLV
ncbi:MULTISPECIES: DUF6708 domain-containing protein [Psychrobacter]|uniref:DUF6708 domain-containing protein n=1 Tax=Psychrobacter TaxID=497 RepID=UPI000C321B82|nr:MULTISPECIES: DUF6708 domain-containing protein [Psychrobacter]PKG35745.1 hypothetical protein CXF65_06000 [Psychrobacter sp. Sarcosine-3u-12]